jgi:hypothetical protein
MQSGAERGTILRFYVCRELVAVVILYLYIERRGFLREILFTALVPRYKVSDGTTSSLALPCQ